MTENEDQGTRLYALIERLKLNPKRFAEAISVSPSFMYQVLDGHKRITARVILGITRVYPRVNINWLIDGTGDMMDDKKQPAEVGLLREASTDARGSEGGSALLAAVVALVEGYEQRIKNLEDRVHRLETRTDYETKKDF